MSAPAGRWRWMAALAALLLACADLPAQQASRPFAEQTSVFRRVLFEDGFQPLTSFEDLDADSVVIILGDTQPLGELARLDEVVQEVDPSDKGNRAGAPDEQLRLKTGLESFLRRGGAVLIATDRPMEGRAAEQLQPFALEVRPWRGPDQTDEQHFYHRARHCPFVQPLPVPSSAPSLFQTFKLPFGGVVPVPAQVAQANQLQVATNSPGYLPPPVDPRYRLHALARLPTGGVDADTRELLNQRRRLRWYDPDDLGKLVRGQRTPEMEGPLFAVGGEVGDRHGRLLILADHSVFSNGMIYRLDNRNLEFTSQCLHWLQEGRPQPRTKVLLLDDGQVVSSFEVPLRAALPLPKPSERAVVAAIDEALAGMEDRNTFDGGLLEMIRTRLPGGTPRLLRGFFLAATLLLFIFGCYRFGVRGVYRRDVQVPLLSEAVAEHRPHAPLPVLRQRAMQHVGNAWEAARALARQCLVDLAPAEADAGPPRFVVAGRAWQRWRRCRRLRWLWRLAFDPAPVPVAPEKLPLLVAELKQVQEDLGRGVIRVE